MLNLKFQFWTYSKGMGPLFFKETIRRLRHFKNQLSERPLKMALNDPWKCFQAPTSALYEVSFNSICGTCLAASLECHQHVFFPLQQGKKWRAYSLTLMKKRTSNLKNGKNKDPKNSQKLQHLWSVINKSFFPFSREKMKGIFSYFNGKRTSNLKW